MAGIYNQSLEENLEADSHFLERLNISKWVLLLVDPLCQPSNTHSLSQNELLQLIAH
jgi:hypothetical protein